MSGQRYPSQGKIAVNDMALPFGGIFDVDQDWETPHITHSRGKAVDVRGNTESLAIPTSQQQEFVEICEDKGAIEAIAHGSGSNRHIHCRWP